MNKSHSLMLYRVSVYIFGFIILLVLIQRAGFEQFLNTLLQVDFAWIIAALFGYSIVWVFRTWRLKQFCRHATAAIGVFELFRLYIASQAINSIFPAKAGDVAMVGFLRGHDIKMGKAAAIIVESRLMDVLALFSLIVLASIWLIDIGQHPWVIKAVIICLFLIIAPKLIVFIDRSKTITQLLERWARQFTNKILQWIVTKLRDAYDGYHDIVNDKSLMVVAVCTSLLIWFFEGFSCFLVAFSVGLPIPYMEIMVAVALGNMGKSIPVTPGGIGLYEGIVAAVLMSFGYAFEVVIVIAILDHIVKKGFNLIVGIFSMAQMEMTMSSIMHILKERPDDH